MAVKDDVVKLYHDVVNEEKITPDESELMIQSRFVK